MKPRCAFFLCVVIGGFVLSGCTPQLEKIEPFLWVKVLPGDSRMSVQWWLTDSTLLYEGNKFGYFKLMRSKDGGKFEAIAEKSNLNPLYAGWCWTDSTCENGTEYRYYVQASFWIFDYPESEGFSDTFSATPEAGLADPRPPAPDSLRNDALVEGSDTVTLRWAQSAEHDSLYYIFLSEAAIDFTIYLENFDGAGRDWDPSGDMVSPVKLDSTVYTFNCDHDGTKRYYKVSVFRDSVMSYPSRELEIEHTWEPD